nr:hypothetical protein Iba_scaffold69456CG0010 [Ipomoea batatas]
MSLCLADKRTATPTQPDLGPPLIVGEIAHSRCSNFRHHLPWLMPEYERGRERANLVQFSSDALGLFSRKIWKTSGGLAERQNVYMHVLLSALVFSNGGGGQGGACRRSDGASFSLQPLH